MKPIIGILARPSKSLNDNDCLIIEEYYKNSILNSGGIPFMVVPPQSISFYSVTKEELKPMTDNEKEDYDRILSMCDGILIPGSTRVYEYDAYALKYAMDKNIPVLGICAGMQLMARIDTDNKNELIDEENSHYVEADIAHKVTINDDTLLYKIIGSNEIDVNSYHKYKVPNCGNNKISAMCGEIIEAIENDNYKFFLGIQWHPERLNNQDSKKLFDYFIEVSKKIH